MTTLLSALNSFLANIHQAEGTNLTWKAYRSDLLGATGFLALSGCKPGMDVSTLTEEMGVAFLQKIMHQKPATRQRRAAAVRRFFRYCSAYRLANISKDRLDELIENGNLLDGLHSHLEFNEGAIQTVLDFTEKWKPKLKKEKFRTEWLRQLRSRAFILTLRDSGMRVHEMCKLKVKDIDFENGTAPIVGKGNKKGVVMFGSKSLAAIQEYITARGEAGKDAPLFMRHDPRARNGTVVLPIQPSTGQEIVHSMVRMALGVDYDPKVTCHKFRHYCVTMILRKTKNLKLAQEYARHSSVATTQRYAHLAPDELKKTRDMVFA